MPPSQVGESGEAGPVLCLPSCCSGALWAGERLKSTGGWVRVFQTCLQQQEPGPFLLFWRASAWITVWYVCIVRLSKCGECQSFSLQPRILLLWLSPLPGDTVLCLEGEWKCHC